MEEQADVVEVVVAGFSLRAGVVELKKKRKNRQIKLAVFFGIFVFVQFLSLATRYFSLSLKTY